MPRSTFAPGATPQHEARRTACSTVAWLFFAWLQRDLLFTGCQTEEVLHFDAGFHFDKIDYTRSHPVSSPGSGGLY